MKTTHVIVALIALLVAPGCGRKRGSGSEAPPDVAAPEPPSIAASAVQGGPAPESETPAAELRAEEREENPQSEIVRLKLAVVPLAKGFIFWGAKKLGPLGPKALELERPRNSGPLDLVVRADGYLPYHTRLYTDRDDRVAIHLMRPGDAPSMLGYRRGTEAAAER